MRNNIQANLPPDNLNEESATHDISKTKVKQAMLALQALGEQLIELKKSELDALALPERLLEAILAAKRLTHWGAIKRQKQYIGRLMRDIDPAPIQAYLTTIQGVSQEHNAWLHRLEKLREALLVDDHALQLLLTEHPDTDVQALRTLIRNVRKERAEGKPPKHFRALFQLLKKMIAEPATPINRKQDESDEHNEHI
jgi:ribosome-associated protein